MMGSKNSRTKDKYTYEHAYYEMSLCKLYQTEAEKVALMKTFNYRSMAPLECHYLKSGCFIPENYILKNVTALRNMPVSIVHGRYDVLCVPEGAMELHKKIPHSTLSYVTAGHSASEPALTKKLKAEMRRFEHLLR